MAAPKLMQILATFDKDAWTSLKKAIIQHIGVSSDCYKVFSFMEKHQADLATIEDVEVIVHKYFKKLGSKTFLNHLSTLYRITEGWIVDEQLHSENHTYQLLLHRNLNKRGLYHQANLVADRIDKQNTSGNTLIDLQTIAQIKHQEHYSFNPIKYEHGVASVSVMIDANLKYIFQRMIIYQIELESWGKIQNYNYSIEQEKLQQICTIIYQNNYPDFFNKLFTLVQSDNVELLHQLINRLVNNEWPHQSFEEVIATLYLIRKTSELRQRGFDIDSNSLLSGLYDYAMTNGVFTDHGKLATTSFRNIVSNLSNFQSFEYTRAFIIKWYLEVATPFPETTRDVCHASNCFKNKRYSEIIELTRMKQFADHQEKVLALLLHLIGVFMQRNVDYDMYVTELHNFTTYLNRHKKEMSIKNYHGISNLLDIMKKVDKKSVKINLKSYDFIFYRAWCEDIVKEE